MCHSPRPPPPPPLSHEITISEVVQNDNKVDFKMTDNIDLHFHTENTPHQQPLWSSSSFNLQTHDQCQTTLACLMSQTILYTVDSTEEYY